MTARIATSPLTGRIHHGRVNKAGDAFIGTKVDVTSDVRPYTHWASIPAATPAPGAARAPRFPMTYCSQCGCEQGPGDEGFSHCSDHRAARALGGGEVS